MVNELFDKIINVELFTELPDENGEMTGEFLDNQIKCNDTGRKPLISISGKISTQTQVTQLQLKVTNLYTDKSFEDYKYVRVTAGYKNNLQTSIIGQIANAYIETPPPDSVTVFEVWIASLSDWTESYIAKNFDKNTSLRLIFDECCNILNMKLDYLLPQDFIVPVDMACHGLIKDTLRKIREFYPDIIIRPEAGTLHVFDETQGTGLIFLLAAVKSAKKDAAGFTVIAPWVPTLRPGDAIRLNPKYYKQAYGGNNIVSTDFRVITIDFDYDTDKKNSMTVFATELR